MPPGAPQSIDELQFIRVDLLKAGIQTDDRSEDGNRHSSHDDRPDICAQPDDEKGSQRRFRKDVYKRQGYDRAENRFFLF